MSLEFKESFIKRYSELTDIDELIKYSSMYLRKSIRVNTLKMNANELKEKLRNFKLTQIPWCKDGFYVSGERTDLGNLIEHSLGYFYIQEAASMIPPLVLAPKKNEIILDMCASPGSKTSQIAGLMNNTGLIIANDVNIKRLKPLTLNLQRMGALNCVLTKMNNFRPKNIKFDKVLVDAPCSGIGAIRKSPKTVGIYNPKFARYLAKTQKRLLSNGFEVLKEKGTLVYSTCTLEPEENEGVIDFLLEKYENAELQDIRLSIKRSEAVLEFEGQSYNKEVRKCLRIWPQDNDTEGFFVAKVKRL